MGQRLVLSPWVERRKGSPGQDVAKSGSKSTWNWRRGLSVIVEEEVILVLNSSGPLQPQDFRNHKELRAWSSSHNADEPHHTKGHEYVIPPSTIKRYRYLAVEKWCV